MLLWALSCFLVAVTANLREDKKIAHLLYEPLENVNNVCVRRSNYTHAVGCQSSHGGQSGILFKIDSSTDVELLMQNFYQESYVALLTSLNLLTRDNMLRFKESGKINGVLVVNNFTSNDLTDFSTADKCPNNWLTKGSGRCSVDRPWNSVGSGLFYESFEFPVVFLPSFDDVSAVLNCYQSLNEPRSRLNTSYPLCSAVIDTFQFSSGNSDVCLRRSQRATIIGSLTADLTSNAQCSPLGGLNSFGQLVSKNNSSPYENSSVIVIACRVDANSYFYGLSPLGTQGYSSGVLTMLAVMDLLSGLSSNELLLNNTNIVFIAFDGEFYDNSGSIRAVYDMEAGKFPQSSEDYAEVTMAKLKRKHIKMFIELSQLVNASSRQLYAYSTQRASEDSEFVQSLNSSSIRTLGKQVELIATESIGDIPPSSLLSFLRNNADFPGVVISDHKGAFRNSFYGDSFDLPTEFGLNETIDSGAGASNYTERLQTVAKFVASLVYQYASNSTKDDINWDNYSTYMDEYAYCMLVNVNCSIINGFQDVNIYQEGVSGRYVSIAEVTDTGTVLTIFRSLFSFALKEEVNSTQNPDCQSKSDQDGTYFYFKLKHPEYDSNYVCYRSPVSFSHAESPAFLSDSNMRSGKYPAWTESFWSSSFSVKLYATGDRSIDIMALTVGIMVTVAAYVLVLTAHFKSQSLFLFTPDPLEVQPDAMETAEMGGEEFLSDTARIVGVVGNNAAYENGNSTAGVFRDDHQNVSTCNNSRNSSASVPI